MSPEARTLDHARAEVEAARPLLLAPNPENLIRSLSHLERAVAAIEAVKSGGLAANPNAREGKEEVRARLSGLKQAIGGLQALLGHAATFYCGWMELSAVACGYTRDGAPARAGLPRSVSVEG